MVGRPSSKQPSLIGAKIAELRHEAGLSQERLASFLGIPQRTLSYYEREAEDMPSSLLLSIAKALGIPIEDLLNRQRGDLKKRGPKSRIELQLEVVKHLPPSEQQFISKFLDKVLQKTI